MSQTCLYAQCSLSVAADGCRGTAKQPCAAPSRCRRRVLAAAASAAAAEPPTAARLRSPLERAGAALNNAVSVTAPLSVTDVGSSTNIRYHETMVPRSDKELLLGQRGCILWLTGAPVWGRVPLLQP